MAMVCIYPKEGATDHEDSWVYNDSTDPRHTIQDNNLLISARRGFNYDVTTIFESHEWNLPYIKLPEKKTISTDILDQ